MRWKVSKIMRQFSILLYDDKLKHYWILFGGNINGWLSVFGILATFKQILMDENGFLCSLPFFLIFRFLFCKTNFWFSTLGRPDHCLLKKLSWGVIRINILVKEKLLLFFYALFWKLNLNFQRGKQLFISVSFSGWSYFPFIKIHSLVQFDFSFRKQNGKRKSEVAKETF